MHDVVIMGAGGLAREVAGLFRASNEVERRWNILGFLAPDANRWGTEIVGLPVLGGDDWWKSYPETHLICAIGNSRLRNQVTESALRAGARFCSVVHPSVEIPAEVSVGKGTIIMAGTRFSANAHVGSHVVVYLNCSITHDADIGDFSLLACNSSLAGGATLGVGVELGTSAVVLPLRKVGDWSVIGAGSVVNRDIPPNTVAAGVPCKILRPRCHFEP